MIRDGKTFLSTGCAGWKGAQEKFIAYMEGKEPADRVAAPAPPIQGFVYFVTAEKAEFPIKIGFTQKQNDLRLRGLQTGCPYPLRVICFVPGTYSDERTMHQRFAESRLEGEWFARTPELMAVIAEAVSTPSARLCAAGGGVGRM
jgi:hypothetical protein